MSGFPNFPGGGPGPVIPQFVKIRGWSSGLEIHAATNGQQFQRSPAILEKEPLPSQPIEIRGSFDWKPIRLHSEQNIYMLQSQSGLFLSAGDDGIAYVNSAFGIMPDRNPAWQWRFLSSETAAASAPPLCSCSGMSALRSF